MDHIRHRLEYLESLRWWQTEPHKKTWWDYSLLGWLLGIEHKRREIQFLKDRLKAKK